LQDSKEDARKKKKEKGTEKASELLKKCLENLKLTPGNSIPIKDTHTSILV